MEKFFEYLSGICFMIAVVFASAMDSENWILAFAFFVAACIGAYGFYRAAEWVHDS